MEGARLPRADDERSVVEAMDRDGIARERPGNLPAEGAARVEDRDPPSPLREDEDALYGLIQCLSAAAHLATASQQTRLRNVYGVASALTNGGPYLDLYVIFFEPEVKGLWPSVLRETLALRDELMKQAPITSVIRRIEFLHASLGNTGLEFTLAEQAR